LSEILTGYTTENRIALSPATRSVELFHLDQIYYGAVRPETVQAVVDEEKTMAAEDIARVKSRYAVVPRDYYQRGNSIFDIHGNDLKQVFIDGAEWAQDEAAKGTLGAGWEAQRRWSEVRNLENFISRPAGSMMIEISAPPDRPAAELKAQGYTGMTHVRVSAKEDDVKIKQYNIILPASGDKFLKELQVLLGAPEGREEPDAQRLLARPLELPAVGDLAAKIKEIESLCGAALLNNNPDKAVLQMIKKAGGARREAWEFVDSTLHAELNYELADKISGLARQNPALWLKGIEQIRIGYMKELRERYDGKVRLAEHGSIIDAAGAQAVAESDVFIVCGGTMETIKGSSNAAESAAQQAARLLHEVRETGTCSACGARGLLYGCGVFCGACNAVWCKEYASSNGRTQLSASQIRYLRMGKGRGNSFVDELIESFQEWNRQYDEQQAIKRKRQPARQPLAG
jgi:hypothetical protein